MSTHSCYSFIMSLRPPHPRLSLFFFNDTATTEIYTLSLHDALPISRGGGRELHRGSRYPAALGCRGRDQHQAREVRLATGDRKSTRLNSSHLVISYAVFCLKKKKKCTVRRHDDDEDDRVSRARSDAC